MSDAALFYTIFPTAIKSQVSALHQWDQYLKISRYGIFFQAIKTKVEVIYIAQVRFFQLS